MKKIPIEQLEDRHEKLRSILIDYGNKEFGDSIVDDICELFDYPTTLEHCQDTPENN
jgi:hypothetical protein